MYSSVTVPIPAVERIWFGDSNVDPIVGHRSDPVLGPDLVFTFADGLASAALQGPLTKRRRYPHRPGARYVGVRFRPGYLAVLADIAVCDVRDGACPVASVWGLGVDEIAEALFASPSGAEYLRRLLERAELPRDVGVPLVGEALAIIRRSAGRARVSAVAAAVGVSMRHLQRVMREHVGVSPKTVVRLARIDAVLAACQRPTVQIADVAADLGFADQAHLSREVRSVLHTTPAELVADAQRSRESPRK